MVFVLTSSQDILEVTVRPQASRKNEPAVNANLTLNLKTQLSEEVYLEQNDYLSIAAQAYYSSINKLDKRHRFKASVSFQNKTNSNINLTKGSSSSGLGYALALFDAFWTLVLNKGDGLSGPIFATGEILNNGEIRAISHVEEKIQGAINFCETNQIANFTVCVPESNKICSNLVIKLEKAGGLLVCAGSLQQLLAQLLGDKYDGDVLGRWEPFKGLESFDHEDSMRFFGRFEDIKRLYTDLNNSEGVLIVTGASGSGKSSLIKAGLIPFIEAKYDRTDWISTTPSSLLDPNQVNGLLQASANHSYDLFLIHIDQLEEIFTLADYVSAIAVLRTLVSKAFESININIILTVQSEYLSDLLETGIIKSPVISPVSGQLSLGSWEEIIYRQAHFSGVELEPSLADLIIADAMAIPNSLPIVEFLLQQLYQKSVADPEGQNTLKLADYKELGGLAGVIANQTKTVLEEAEITDLQLNQFFALFVGQANNGVAFARLVKESNAYPSHVLKIIRTLNQANLLVMERVRGDTFYKMAHDSLFKNWPSLKSWIENNNAFLKWKNQVEHQFQKWIESTDGYHFLIKDRTLIKEGKKYDHDGLIIDKSFTEYIEFSSKQSKRNIKFLIVAVAFLLVSFVSLIPSFSYTEPEIEVNTLSCETNAKDIEGIKNLIIYVSHIGQAKKLEKELCQETSYIAGLVTNSYERIKIHWGSAEGYSVAKLFSGEIAMMPSSQASLDVGAIISNKNIYTEIAKNPDYFSCLVSLKENGRLSLSPENLNNKTFGLLSKRYSQSGFQVPYVALIDLDVSPSQMKYYHSHSQLYHALENAEVDIAGTYCPSGKNKLKYSSQEIGNKQVGFSWYVSNNIKIKELKCFFQEFLLEGAKNSNNEYFRNLSLIGGEDCEVKGE